MKKYILLLMLLILIACNESEDDMSDSQQWSSDTIPNPGEGESGDKSDAMKNKNDNEANQTSPFQKEEITGEWDVTMIATAKSCENKDIAPVVKERWFINFEDERLNITVMTKGSEIKQYWGYFEGKRMKAIADKKLTKQEMELLNQKETQRNSLNLEVNATNLINGLRVSIAEDQCRTDYSVTMKR
ncbi:MAG: hypothetical protein RIF34_02660 [Candidatus Kapaibacterium sp.]